TIWRPCGDGAECNRAPFSGQCRELDVSDSSRRHPVLWSTRTREPDCEESDVISGARGIVQQAVAEVLQWQVGARVSQCEQRRDTFIEADPRAFNQAV